MLCSVCNEDFEKLVNLDPKLCSKCYYKQYSKKEICCMCKKEKRISKRNEKGEAICPSCAQKDNIGFCEICKKNDVVIFKSKESGLTVCGNCRKKRKCGSCGKFKVIKKDTNLCCMCFNHTKDKREICSICKEFKEVHKRIEKKPLCSKCSRIGYEYPKDICLRCGRLRRVNKRTEDGYAICGTCYDGPKNFCVNCGEFAQIAKREGNFGLCFQCYRQPEKICSSCGKVSKIEKNIDAVCLCKNCFSKFRHKTDLTFRIISSLRGSLRRAFRMYSIQGKKYSSKKYGIDYYKIVEYLGDCPGNWEDYQIDHIFPLSAFNFDDLEQIKIAFIPENHQWLKKEDNLSKNDKYDEMEFQKFLDKYLPKEKQ